jgi:glycosyltransferase involved in cell wall biosynthesis
LEYRKPDACRHFHAGLEPSENGSGPALSIVLCTIGRSREIARLLTSLLRQSFSDFEIILVDQNPPGYLRDILEQFTGRLSVHLVRSDPGLSRARNVGLKLARGRIICFPDDDCWYEGDVAQRVFDFFDRNSDIDVLLGRTVAQDGVKSTGSFRLTSGPVSKWNVWVSGCSTTLFVRQNVTKRVGGFDESLGVGCGTIFQSGEETDFVLNSLKLGFKSFYDSGLRIYHESVDTGGDKQFARALRYSAGFGRVLKKHDYGLPYLLYRVIRSLARCILCVLSFHFRTAKYKLIWAVGTIRGYFAESTVTTITTKDGAVRDP